MQAMLLRDELDNDYDGFGEEPDQAQQPAEGDVEMRKDNRDITDNDKAQKLTAEDIEQMKDAETDGKKIINALIANSESWNKRTKFSQAKFIKMKSEKYLINFETRMPTAEELVETYMSFMPAKICNLRVDSLGLLLNMANINAHARVMLVDGTKGLVTGAILERCAAYTLSVQTGQTNLKVSSEILGNFNFGHESLHRLGHVHADVLASVAEGGPADMVNKGLALANKSKFNSCVIVSDIYHPLELWNLVNFTMQTSANVAVFSQYVQPLVEL